MTIETTVVTKVGTATSLTVWAVEKPSNANLPCVVYRMFQPKPYVSHSGESGLVRTRFQFTVLGSTASSVASAVSAIRGLLDWNITDFSATQALGSGFIDKIDGVFRFDMDYYLFYQE